VLGAGWVLLLPSCYGVMMTRVWNMVSERVACTGHDRGFRRRAPALLDRPLHPCISIEPTLSLLAINQPINRWASDNARKEEAKASLHGIACRLSLCSARLCTLYSSVVEPRSRETTRRAPSTHQRSNRHARGDGLHCQTQSTHRSSGHPTTQPFE
jgi:hypothetical protein